ncbi:MAG: hypothetical protein DRP01_04795 [Archaeoglobales archaeon]|nr:MAG: hypothetical protein DRP01_04795 [Archaeoglobales archaeon]
MKEKKVQPKELGFDVQEKIAEIISTLTEIHLDLDFQAFNLRTALDMHREKIKRIQKDLWTIKKIIEEEGKEK